MGGVYLVRYKDSPVGAFDELVVLAGLVWNAPTSCAWAQRVYVSSKTARNHGLQSVGLPSRLATFSQPSKPHAKAAKVSAHQAKQGSWWCGAAVKNGKTVAPGCAVVVQNVERGARGLKAPVAEFLLPEALPRKGPRMPLTLPNFSGGTVDHPGLLHYTCKMLANIRPAPAIRAVQSTGKDVATVEDVSHVLKGKPLLCLEFRDLVMRVPEAQPWKPKVKRSSDVQVVTPLI